MKIGQLAQIAGVSVDTVRFYERRGVLPRPERLSSGYRVYSTATLERLRFVKSLQALGFTLDEAADGLRALDRGGATCASERWRGEKVVQRIDRQLDDLRRVRERVVRALSDCDANACRPEPGRTGWVESRQD